MRRQDRRRAATWSKSEFIEGAKASGLLQRLIERAGLRGFEVAPLKHN
jgi:hypothetical protein